VGPGSLRGGALGCSLLWLSHEEEGVRSRYFYRDRIDQILLLLAMGVGVVWPECPDAAAFPSHPFSLSLAGSAFSDGE
jgi:hypothetical protein